MDPVTATTLALASQAATAGLGAISARSQAEAEAEQAQRNAFIGRTRALQTDVSARQGLEDELSTLRSSLSANSQRPNSGTFEIFQEFRRTRDRERSIEFGNRNLEAANFRTEAANARSRGRMALPLGLSKAGPSLFDLFQTL